MYKKLRQVGAVGALILLLLGPSVGNLFHMHEANHLDLCMHEGVTHLHTADNYSVECFLCSFSFSTFQVKEREGGNVRKFSTWECSPPLYVDNIHFSTLSPSHAPRAPPFLHTLSKY